MSDTGLIAVEDAMSVILTARYPGTTWVSTHRATTAPLTRQTEASS